MTRILCLGDSITDCGRFFSSSPLRNGYVKMLSHSLASAGILHEMINCGIDGFTVARLLENAESYAAKDADIITILIGINDIGLMMNTCRTPEQQADMMLQFSRHYDKLLTILTNSAKTIILMEPFIFPWPAEYRNWIPHVKAMSGKILTLADKYSFPYIRLHQDLNEEARRYGLDMITPDGIHLTAQGHKILAQKLFSEFQDKL